MRIQILLFLAILSGMGCNINKKSIHGSFAGDKVFSLKVKPVNGSKITYDISNETKSTYEVNDKKIENITKSEVTVFYSISLDSTGNYLVNIKYEKVHVNTKVGETESDYNTEEAVSDTDPVFQMLTALKASNIHVIVKSSGEVIRVDGYQDILNHIFGGINKEDAYTKAVVEKQWQQMVEQNLVKKNLRELFEIFPDSAVHIGDKWKYVTTQTENVAFKITNMFILKSVDDGLATLESRGTITPDSTTTSISGFDATSNITGEQQGDFEVDLKTGLPKSSQVTLNIDGNIQINGRDVPFSVNSFVKISETKKN